MNVTRSRATGVAIAGAVLVAAFQQSIQAQNGAWTQPFSLPLISMHAAMLPTGKVLLYSADHGVPGVEGYLLDPVTLALTDVQPPWTPACSGHSFLADGRLLVTGGQVNDNPPTGTQQTHIFNPWTQQWSQVEDMRMGRWYPSNVTLGDGRVVTFSGLDINGDFNPLIEAYVPGGTNNWQLLGQRIMDYYPNLHLLPNGKIFRAGPNDTGTTDTYDLTNDVWTFVAYRNVPGGFDAPTVMVPPNPNQIMVMGGNNRTNEPTADAEMIDLGSPSPRWTTVPPMHYARQEFNAAILPDGKIFVVGGRTNNDTTELYVLTPEIFDPQTLTWTLVAPHQIPHAYHSTAILLPDARVLVSGGENMPYGEIFSPPYLSKESRPVIQSAPSLIGYGETFSLSFTSGTASNRVALVRYSCVTHSVNMEERYVRLADLSGGSGTFTVPAPATSNLAPPGYYMLYVVDQNGVPSVSATVQVLAPVLKILEAHATGNGSIQLFWSLAFPNATVQTTASLNSPVSWSSQPGSPSVQQGRYMETVPVTSNPEFFRLSSP